MSSSNPNYKVEVWEPGAGSALYSLTSDCSRVSFKDTLTQNVGTFNVILAAQKGFNYYYSNIDLWDTVKIWLGYGTLSGDPNFVGKIYNIVGQNKPQVIRVISGRSQSEVLQRRLKGEKQWVATEVDDIVAEIANDLSLGTGQIATDTTTVNYNIDVDRYETYFRLLQDISDYWYSGAVQIKKDFYVDNTLPTPNLVWKARPIRTVGVETLTVGQNINSSTVSRFLDTVQNKIYVYGAPERRFPATDLWTETLDINGAGGDDWKTATADGTVSLENTIKLVGTYSIEHSTTSPQAYVDLWLDLPTSAYYLNLKQYPCIIFHLYREGNYANSGGLVIYDSGGKVATRFLSVPTANMWNLVEVPAGPKNISSWHLVESGFDWENVSDMHIQLDGCDPAGKFYVDDFRIGKRNFQGMAEYATSQTNYGLREASYLDEELRSDNECQQRAETLLYQLEDPQIRIDINVIGNLNLLIGDRLSITIPQENISAQNYDVVEVEHILLPDQTQGFSTNIAMLNSANMRQLPAVSATDILKNEVLNRRETSNYIYRIH